MRHLIFSILVLSGIIRAEAQTLGNCTLQQFQNRVLQDNDTLYVVNFWATWCSPCVKELPYFIDLSSEMAQQPVKFILMSLDASGDGNKVAAFLNKKKIRLETHLFTEADPNIWINALEPSWQGSIPATFLYHKGAKMSFQEGSFESEKDLKTFIKNHK